MKRVTKINLQNCRAYFGDYDIDLPQGENLIIYGENGSGKSSLFKSFYSFFRNSITPQTFIKNLYNEDETGKIELTFSEIDEFSDISKTDSFKFSNIASNNSELFIKESSLLNGFLDYTDLLKIYLKSEPNPNLFDLVVINLLGEFIPVTTGRSDSIGSQYNNIMRNLVTLSKTRNGRFHKIGLKNIPVFKNSLKITLDSIFRLLNEYLSKYFGLHDITISYDLKEIEFKYPTRSKASWFLDTDLRLNISKNGDELGNDYKDYLNEARLSSVAICLYLASLKLYPKNVDYKMIYLDDIFIGLDTSNRIPIINILNDQFSDYQIFISTYDKNFFEVCNQKLKKAQTLWPWKSVEIYVGEKVLDKKCIDVPIILSDSDDLSKSRYYLYNLERPDYPAAANYFRKFLENKLIEFFPPEIFKDKDLLQLESFKLSKLFNLCFTFLQNVGVEAKELNIIHSYLFILLHPLSHFNSSQNTYKRDLKEIDHCIKETFENGKLKLILSDFRFCIFKNNHIRLCFYINQYNIWYYEFHISDSLFFIEQKRKFSNVKLTCTRFYNIKNNKLQRGKKLNKSTSNIKYNSIDDANVAIGKLILKEYRFYKSEINVKNNIQLFDGTVWTNFM